MGYFHVLYMALLAWLANAMPGIRNLSLSFPKGVHWYTTEIVLTKKKRKKKHFSSLFHFLLSSFCYSCWSSTGLALSSRIPEIASLREEYISRSSQVHWYSRGKFFSEFSTHLYWCVFQAQLTHLLWTVYQWRNHFLLQNLTSVSDANFGHTWWTNACHGKLRAVRVPMA